MGSAPPNPHVEVSTLYSDHHGWLYGWLRKRLGNAFDAADLAHDTYVRVIVSGRTPQPEDSRRFLSQIAKGLAVDLYRRRQIETAYLETIALLAPAETPSEETRAIVMQTLVQLDTLLQKLPAKARQALLLSRLEGLSYREIAQQLNVSISSVEKYVATALQACYAAEFGIHE